MPSNNLLSHREQHRITRRDVETAYRNGLDRKLTVDEYRLIRHDVARHRRAEQQRARVTLGTDRASIRALRAMDAAPRIRGQIRALAAFFGRD